PTRPFTQYWIAEGNENLHGEGWAGTNPTRNDQTSVLFTNNLVKNPTGANLTVLLIAGNQGQPDFLFFNDQQMGTGPAAPGHASLLVTDIANEQSFDAASGSGKQTRYADAEIFTVSQFMATENNVTFIRGIDINGDGTIDTSGSQPEGEDYIHPCSAILAVSSRDTPLTDISVENIQVVNAYENEVATISADLHSYGIIPKTPVPVVFQADGVTINSTTILIPANGILTVTVPWTARAGTVELSANADVKDDARVANNRAAKTLTIGSPADLSLSIDAPYPADKAQTTTAQKSPILPALAVSGILCAGILIARRSKGSALPALLFGVMLVISCAGIPAVDAAPVTGTKEYTLPVRIQNNGGSDSPAFLVCVYLDGERVAEKTVTGGIPAHGSTTLLMPLFTTPGSHGISVTVDEAGTIRDSNKANNSIRGTYVFP
ncbi:MAG: CARDB domain-containing protein, partial [Methanoregula sp.]